MGELLSSSDLVLIILAISVAVLLIGILLTVRRGKQHAVMQAYIEALRSDMLEESRNSRMETTQNLASMLQGSNDRLNAFARQNAEMIRASDGRLANFVRQNAEQLEGMRQTIQNRLQSIQEENTRKLDEMRATVDEKLQKTLETRITESFRMVGERLEQVYKGLGEMQNLAQGVGDLKKVFSNVKTRGILGEIQLGAILEDILSPDQYVRNYAPRAGSRVAVKFAIRLPGEGDAPVYLPVDAKFPADPYAALQEAYDAGEPTLIEAAAVALRRALSQAARDIHQKYIQPPDTTDFGILFLPFEGLYAEVVRRGMLEAIRREHKVVVAGPSTMAALLNSLQMGFKTLAIQKRSSEVWMILGAVKTEFDKFEATLKVAQRRIDQAHDDLDQLIGTRTRQIQRKLRTVTELPEAESARMLDDAATPDWGGESDEG